MQMKHVRQRTAELLENRHDDYWSHLLDIGLVVLIILNVCAVVLESVSSLAQAYKSWFWAFELFSIIIFSLEYVLRVWSSLERSKYAQYGPVKGRLRYMVSPYAIIDLLAILPFFIGLFSSSIDLRSLRVIRLLRLFKLSRYSNAMQALLHALHSELDSLAAAFFLLFVLFVLASSGIYLIENQAQPNTFGSIPAAMWWAMATLTTVGYGDVVPVTVLGKVFGGFITIIGVGMVALPAGIIASGFSEHLRQRRAGFDALFITLTDKQASANERQRAANTIVHKLSLNEITHERLRQMVKHLD